MLCCFIPYINDATLSVVSLVFTVHTLYMCVRMCAWTQYLDWTSAVVCSFHV